MHRANHSAQVLIPNNDPTGRPATINEYPKASFDGFSTTQSSWKDRASRRLGHYVDDFATARRRASLSISNSLIRSNTGTIWRRRSGSVIEVIQWERNRSSQARDYKAVLERIPKSSHLLLRLAPTTITTASRSLIRIGFRHHGHPSNRLLHIHATLG